MESKHLQINIEHLRDATKLINFCTNIHKYVMLFVMENNLQKELKYFKKHQEELVKQYDGKFIVIKNQKVEGVYDTEIEAYTEAQKKFELGTFMIQLCVAGKENYTQSFYSRVSFL